MEGLYNTSKFPVSGTDSNFEFYPNFRYYHIFFSLSLPKLPIILIVVIIVIIISAKNCWRGSYVSLHSLLVKCPELKPCMHLQSCRQVGKTPTPWNILRLKYPFILSLLFYLFWSQAIEVKKIIPSKRSWIHSCNTSYA